MAIEDELMPQLRIGDERIAYFDYAALGQYIKPHLEAVNEALYKRPLINPHSALDSALLYNTGANSTDRDDDFVQSTREMIRELVGASEDYAVIFTRNASHAIQMFAQHYPVEPRKTRLWILEENHTSVHGISDFMHSRGALVQKVSRLNDIVNQIKACDSEDRHLIILPAQSNFNGHRYPVLQVARLLADYHVDIFSDVASFVSTSRYDMDDMITACCVSFGKLFGVPGHLGALVVHRDIASKFRTNDYPYCFGGGTVEAMTMDWHVLRTAVDQRGTLWISEQMEDGTLPLADILSLRIGFEKHREFYGEWDALSSRLRRWTTWLIGWMSSQTHRDIQQTRLFTLFLGDGERAHNVVLPTRDPTSREELEELLDSFDSGFIPDHGPVITFSVHPPLLVSQRIYSPSHIITLAALNKIVLRHGLMCNVGAAMKHLGLKPELIKHAHEKGWRCGRPPSISGPAMEGAETLEGCLRLSMGRGTILDDIWKWITFVRSDLIYDDVSTRLATLNIPSNRSVGVLKDICVFPIKSAHSLSTKSWRIGCSGTLEFDRQWILVKRTNGRTLTQKQCPKMALLRPEIDFQNHILRVYAPDRLPLIVSLQAKLDFTKKQAEMCGLPINVDEPSDVESHQMDVWFSDFLGVDVRFVRCPIATTSFAQESPILLVSETSLARVNEQICVKQDGLLKHSSQWDKNGQVPISCFRGNLIIHTHDAAFCEDSWQKIMIGSQAFRVNGPCRRCQMICINQETGERNTEPYLSLSELRKVDGQLLFGIHLTHLPHESKQPFVLHRDDLVHKMS